MSSGFLKTDAARRLSRALEILREVRDVLDERVDEAPPAWCERRGWTRFLLDLSDDELHHSEAEGFAALAAGLNEATRPAHETRAAGLPASLGALAAAVSEATRLPAWEARATSSEEGARGAGAATTMAESIGVSARKRPQLAGLLGAVEAMASHAARIVDVGSGSGHFTRIAAERFERETVGLERNGERVAAARAAAVRGEARRFEAQFREVDAGKEELAFEPDDLAVGLHACGALGDRLVLSAAAAGCDVALVSCCLQKIDGAERAPLSRAAAGFALRRETLGLTNLSSRARGVESSIEATMAARQTRHALLHLLRARGLDVVPGEEMRGINRRRARAGLRDIAERALSLRGLPPPSHCEIESHEREAQRRYALVRRLSLPRNMLARLVEIAVVLDRAAALEESGHCAEVVTIFESAVTPRNIALFASRDRARIGRHGSAIAGETIAFPWARARWIERMAGAAAVSRR